MKTWFYRLLIELTNHKFTSALLKKFSQSKISKFLIPSYAKVYNINQEEMLYDIDTYENLHEFFTRKLKPGVRSFVNDEKVITSPVDGVLEDYGIVESDKIITVKGKQYSILEMIGDEHRIKKYIGGKFLILYLSPSHYHRIHSPIDGEIITQYTLGTKSYPVNRYGLKYGKSPLSKNYRVITELKAQGNHLLFVKVGAMFINSIECMATHQNWQKGEEVAYFSFGSTVVLLFEKDTFEIQNHIHIPYDIQVGEPLGHIK
ncbi:phosphatidylserine decarboxylase [Heyndrickxia camelliae]|uniref:Phosphatidylserine decarboxylase proenzyme n=1 Tax=Heyndrickxia camelliae TaxID=1707093 RepID=A0A2N3LKS6_9BACI|nr:phosphatidylserine decarboxylase [Heyndrickxia camelliae]PKR85144.1 phosphatidylserine decarboxylase [Heyndrickxia camelliae]